MDIQVFVQNVKRLLDERGISYSRAGRESGAGIDFVRNMERLGTAPSIEKVSQMADYLGVSVGELLGEDTKPTPIASGPPGLPELGRIYRSLNDEGREKLLDYAADLEASGRYIKSGPAQLGQAKDA